jgi:hypothetical protein
MEFLKNFSQNFDQNSALKSTRLCIRYAKYIFLKKYLNLTYYIYACCCCFRCCARCCRHYSVESKCRYIRPSIHGTGIIRNLGTHQKKCSPENYILQGVPAFCDLVSSANFVNSLQARV